MLFEQNWRNSNHSRTVVDDVLATSKSLENLEALKSTLESKYGHVKATRYELFRGQVYACI